MDSVFVDRSNSEFESFCKGNEAAIVGNSGNLAKTEYGDEIDNHESVVRFNKAPVCGEFENQVGCKKLFRFLNGKCISSKRYLKKIKNEVVIITPNPVKTRYRKAKNLLDKSNRIFIIEDIFKESIKKNHNIENPSSGLFSVLIFRKFFDVLNLYGFSFYKSTYRLHYWEDHKNYKDHKWNSEKRLIYSLEGVNINE